MRFQEKMQYKLRNFLYEQNRKKQYKRPEQPDKIEGVAAGKLINALDEMDQYLDEKIKNIPLPKIRKNE